MEQQPHTPQPPERMTLDQDRDRDRDREREQQQQQREQREHEREREQRERERSSTGQRKVRAKAPGFYDNGLRERDDEFVLLDAAHFSDTWMEDITAETAREPLEKRREPPRDQLEANEQWLQDREARQAQDREGGRRDQSQPPTPTPYQEQRHGEDAARHPR